MSSWVECPISTIFRDLSLWAFQKWRSPILSDAKRPNCSFWPSGVGLLVSIGSPASWVMLLSIDRRREERLWELRGGGEGSHVCFLSFASWVLDEYDEVWWWWWWGCPMTMNMLLQVLSLYIIDKGSQHLLKPTSPQQLVDTSAWGPRIERVTDASYVHFVCILWCWGITFVELAKKTIEPCRCQARGQSFILVESWQTRS